MGNCLKTEASDDESLLGDSDEGERQSRRNRRNRRRTRVQGYMANNAPSIPDPTHYFNLGMSWQASYRKHSFLIRKRPIVWVRIWQMFSQFYYGSNAFFSFNFFDCYFSNNLCKRQWPNSITFKWHFYCPMLDSIRSQIWRLALLPLLALKSCAGELWLSANYIVFWHFFVGKVQFRPESSITVNEWGGANSRGAATGNDSVLTGKCSKLGWGQRLDVGRWFLQS